MREYLYIWNNPEEQFIVASGLEFKDLAPQLSAGGVILLEHNSEVTRYDRNSLFEYVPRAELPKLVKENIYSWGNFSWVDYSADTAMVPEIPPEDVAAVLYYGHARKPLHGIRIESLGNQFLAYAHDDGWFLQLYYIEWEPLWGILSKICPELLPESIARPLQEGSLAFWINDHIAEQEEKTYDVDSVLNRRL
jgi:hypothetical protein